MRDRSLDPELLRAARHGLLVGLWIAGLGMLAYLVVGGAQLGLDSHAYWLALRVDHPYGLEPHAVDAYLYSPLFLQVLHPLVLLPWSVFVLVWAGLQAGVVWWLVRPLSLMWRLPILLLCLPEFFLGNVHALMAASLVLGFSRPGWLAFLPLTKVEPAIPAALWLAFSGEWSQLLRFAVWIAGLTSISALAAPQLWAEWLQFLVRGHELDMAMWVRLAVSIAVVLLAARRGWISALPVAVLLAIPTDGLGVSGIVIMTAVPRLARLAHEPLDVSPTGRATTARADT